MKMIEIIIYQIKKKTIIIKILMIKNKKKKIQMKIIKKQY